MPAVPHWAAVRPALHGPLGPVEAAPPHARNRADWHREVVGGHVATRDLQGRGRRSEWICLGAKSGRFANARCQNRRDQSQPAGQLAGRPLQRLLLPACQDRLERCNFVLQVVDPLVGRA